MMAKVRSELLIRIRLANVRHQLLIIRDCESEQGFMEVLQECNLWRILP
jgi:hypothetical protein